MYYSKKYFDDIAVRKGFKSDKQRCNIYLTLRKLRESLMKNNE